MKTLILLSLINFSLLAKSTHYHLPQGYEDLSACAKQQILWDLVEKTKHSELPEFKKFGALQLLGMGIQAISKKESRVSDVAPKGWKKYLHRRGSVAKVKIIPVENQPFTGVFEGADCALVRLSITYRPKGKRDFAPGLALKIFRDQAPSANVSALYKLDGQGDNFNYFEHPLSNIVPIGTGVGLKLVHSIFRKVSDYPEEILVDHLAERTQDGKKVKGVNSPRQIFFVPTGELSFSSSEHDVREDFHSIPAGTTLYKVYAAPEKYDSFDYYDYEPEDIKKFVSESIPVANIVTTSPFISSEFGDTGIFFRHELRPKK